MPKVSIITPAYNSERFLRQTVESALAQTFQDFEMIIVDDGSKDKTAEIAESFGAQVVCFRQPNGGVCSARNLAIANSTGEYLAFLDSDDLWDPTKLEKQVALLDSRPKIGLCFAAVQRIDENDLPLNRIEAIDYPDFCEALLLYSCVVAGSCSSAMMRRSLIAEAGEFDTNYTNYEDWEYWLRLSLVTKFAAMPEYLVNYRLVSGSATFKPHLVERDMIKILDSFFGSPDLPQKYKAIENKSRSNNWMIVSGEYLHAGDVRSSLRCLSRALRLYPQNLTRPLGLPFRLSKRLLKI